MPSQELSRQKIFWSPSYHKRFITQEIIINFRFQLLFLRVSYIRRIGNMVYWTDHLTWTMSLNSDQDGRTYCKKLIPNFFPPKINIWSLTRTAFVFDFYQLLGLANHLFVLVFRIALLMESKLSMAEILKIKKWDNMNQYEK